MWLNSPCTERKPKSKEQPRSCGGFKLLNTGGDLSVPTVVRSLTTTGSKLTVTNTDGSTYDLELPKAEPANVSSVRVLNASGSTVVATVAALI